MEELVIAILTVSLTHFRPMFSYCTSLKHQKTLDFVVFSGEYELETLARNGLT